ncbi:MAG: potassium transporter TrkG [bacterium]|nr:potassium transporter TrkG [bacterium]
MSFMDRLFTATSATCVTGLTVMDVHTRLSLSGQICLLLLIQFGGLSLMAFSSVFILVLGKKISLRDKLTLKEVLNRYDMKNINHVVRYIIFFTFIAELAGALILYGKWTHIQGPLTRFYFAVFHSISAFCNAGFSLFQDNLNRFQNDAITVFTITTLIITGGLGFFVHFELKDLFINRIKGFFRFITGQDRVIPMKLSLHSKMVLSTTLFLILTGIILLGLMEYNHLLAGKTFGNKFLIAYFQSVTPRTAGFNTIDISMLTTSSLVIIILFMFTGGSPGSTAGGIKTTSLATIFFTIRSILQGREKVTAFFKTIDDETVKKVLTIFILAFCLVLTATLLILIREGSRFLFIQVLFEVVSAFGTVGLSTGITSHLSDFSKLILVLVMFTGRVGPLTFAISIIRKESTGISFPEENIGVG